MWSITVNKTATYDDMKQILISSSKNITKQHWRYLTVWKNELAESVVSDIQKWTHRCNALNKAVKETMFTNLLDYQPLYSPDMLNNGNNHSSEVEINCKIAVI